MMPRNISTIALVAFALFAGLHTKAVAGEVGKKSKDTTAVKEDPKKAMRDAKFKAYQEKSELERKKRSDEDRARIKAAQDKMRAEAEKAIAAEHSGESEKKNLKPGKSKSNSGK